MPAGIRGARDGEFARALALGWVSGEVFEDAVGSVERETAADEARDGESGDELAGAGGGEPGTAGGSDVRDDLMERKAGGRGFHTGGEDAMKTGGWCDAVEMACDVPVPVGVHLCTAVRVLRKFTALQLHPLKGIAVIAVVLQ